MRVLLDAAERAARYTPLTGELLAGALAELPGWTCDGTRLLRTLRPRDLWTLLEQVVDVEEELDHHAEVTLDRGAVTFALWTHVRNAVTTADVELAQRLDAISARLGIEPPARSR